ncbi:MAG TPA: DsrE family protein [Candidatus Bathyarchaeia archaeon]|nr:DsrE family protein [Candidatus Bathyarchaeia archaeon]
MSAYLFVEPRDPLEADEVLHFYALALGLARDRHPVMLFLLNDGVLPASRSQSTVLLRELVEAGVEITADETSLRQRGIATSALAAGVRPATIDVVFALLAAGRTVIWQRAREPASPASPDGRP